MTIYKNTKLPGHFKKFLSVWLKFQRNLQLFKIIWGNFTVKLSKGQISEILFRKINWISFIKFPNINKL